MLEKCLTVDTGLTTAWAWWKSTEYPETGEFKCNLHLNPVERVNFMAGKFFGILMRYRPSMVILEMVELWSGSLKSQTAATRGDIFWDALLIGAYILRAYDAGAHVQLLTAREWKGQLSKEATVYRVKCINGFEYASDHITDAVAMGFSRDRDLWHLRRKF